MASRADDLGVQNWRGILFVPSISTSRVPSSNSTPATPNSPLAANIPWHTPPLDPSPDLGHPRVPTAQSSSSHSRCKRRPAPPAGSSLKIVAGAPYPQSLLPIPLALAFVQAPGNCRYRMSVGRIRLSVGQFTSPAPTESYVRNWYGNVPIASSRMSDGPRHLR